MLRIRLASAQPFFPVLLCSLLACSGGGEAPPADPELTPGIDLTRVGTLGDYPLDVERVVVNVDSAGRVTVNDQARSLDALGVYLQARAGESREQNDARSSRLHVVLRLDRTLPWGVAEWLLRICGDPRRRIYRIHFAVLPEEGEEEGTLASYLSPDSFLDLLDQSIWVTLKAKGPAASPERLGELVRRIVDRFREQGKEPPAVSLDAWRLTPVDFVLRAMDALYRAGVRAIQLRGSGVHPRDKNELADLVAEARATPVTCGIVLLEQALDRVEAPPLLRVERVRGGYAGTTDPPRGWLPPSVPRPTERPRTEAAVDLGLEWLKDHQDPKGFWDCDGFMKMDKVTPICDGSGRGPYDPAVTGLALLAFLGAGETHKHGRYRKSVRNGLKYLKQIQDAEGCFGPRKSDRFVFNHAIATLAMCESYALTLSPLFKQSAQHGIDFIHRCRNPNLAWRYGVRPGNDDTAVSGWMTMALMSAKSIGLRVEPEALDGMRAWLKNVTDPATGRVGYTWRGSPPFRCPDRVGRYPADLSESLTAVGVLSRLLLGEVPEDSLLVRQGGRLIERCPPVWNVRAGSIDMHYWYFGTLASFQLGREPWDRWCEALKPEAIGRQRKDGAFRGSWDPAGVWGREGGRVYATALMTICTEAYYRYAKVFGLGTR